MDIVIADYRDMEAAAGRDEGGSQLTEGGLETRASGEYRMMT